MADSAALALQAAINTVLHASSAVTALVGTRIYDQTPQNVAFPHIELGDTQDVDDGAQCMEDAVEVFIDVHVWSRAVGKVEVGRIAQAVKTVLHEKPPAMTGWRCVEIEVQTIRTMTEPDDVTKHAVLTIRASIDPVD